ncbi:MAG TPA: 3-hydroxyacyl-CoA dehydrogenase NAD-binding domain-containing protein [Dongiaceae bacterium]|jgi:3-hydroxyacyl-CoA dehydrogenase|nr:3-hydroxyacyl-CoA dehydrogenase NAD-binding domain-containing protein [Dongiaceae bacterium]
MGQELSSTVTLLRRGRIGLISCDNPPVNAISRSIRVGLYEAIQQVLKDDSLDAGVIICRGKTFFAGADITEFGQPDSPPTWQALDRAIDLSPKPLIAAIHGTCFGGGFELALACQYRIANSGARFSFPEVKLGVIPGGGGTQRFARLAGFEAALDLIPTGRVMGAQEALSMGAVDRLSEGDLEADALAFAETVLAAGKGKPLPRARERSDKIEAARAKPELFKNARAVAQRRMRGAEAPLQAIQAIENALTLDFDAAMQAEVESFRVLEKGPQHRALGCLFFAEREARRVPDLPADTRLRPIDSVAVIGGGTMGRGITLALADNGIAVTLIEVSEAAREKAMQAVQREINGSVAKGRISEQEGQKRLACVSSAADIAAAATADLVVEAVFEDMATKIQVFQALDKVAKRGAILASNTSNLDINKIARATGRPADVVGLHFFSPANIMKLLEIVRGDDTAPDVLATMIGFAKRIGKQAVVARVCDGFIANRAFDQYWRQTRFLVEEGASPYDIDKALYDFGMPMGPFQVSDLVGLDVSAQIRKNRKASLPAEARLDTIEDELAESGRWGQKNGLGWYRYESGSRAGVPDQAVLDAIDAYRKREGFTPRRISPDEILERCIYTLVNEGAKEVEEGIAIRASDIDIAAVYGFGFPSHRGGPMHYAEEIGLKSVAARVEAFHAEKGYWWRPSRLLLDLAKTGRRFSDR